MQQLLGEIKPSHWVVWKPIQDHTFDTRNSRGQFAQLRCKLTGRDAFTNRHRVYHTLVKHS